MKAVSNESGDLLNDTTTSSPSPQAEMTMSWFLSFQCSNTMTGSFHRKGYLMLHNLAGANIHVANLVNYNRQPSRGWKLILLKDGNDHQ